MYNHVKGRILLLKVVIDDKMEPDRQGIGKGGVGVGI